MSNLMVALEEKSERIRQQDSSSGNLEYLSTFSRNATNRCAVIFIWTTVVDWQTDHQSNIAIHCAHLLEILYLII